MKPIRVLAVLCVGVAALTGCSTPKADPIPPAPRYDTMLSDAPIERGEELESTPKFYRAGRLVVGGQPKTKDIDAMARQGVTHVINLRSNREMSRDELATWEDEVRAMGLEYTHIPLGGDDGYEPADVESFRAALAGVDGTALVHCGSGGRVRTMWMAYLIEEHGYDPNDAVEIAGTLGGQRSSFERLLGREVEVRLGRELTPEEITPPKDE